MLIIHQLLKSHEFTANLLRSKLLDLDSESLVNYLELNTILQTILLISHQMRAPAFLNHLATTAIPAAIPALKRI